MFIYTLSDPREPKHVRYVGRCVNIKKRLARHVASSELNSKTHKNNWIKKLKSENIHPTITIIEETSDAIEREKYWILFYSNAGHKLTNVYDCKDGRITMSEDLKIKISKALKGHLVSDATRRKISKSHTGKKLSKQTRDKMSASKKGKPFSGIPFSGPLSQATKDKISAKHKGKKRGDRLTDDGRDKISKTHKGKIVSFETRNKLSISNKNKVITESTKIKLRTARAKCKVEPHFGKPHSEETKKKLSVMMSGKNHPQYGKKRSAETIAKIKATKLRQKLSK